MKIRKLNNFGHTFQTYLIVVNYQIRKFKKWKEDNVLFKPIEEEKTCIKVKYKDSANIVSSKLNAKPQGKALNRKYEFVEWLKYRKTGCKYEAYTVYKHVKKNYDKCHKRRHVFCIHDNYIALNRGINHEGCATSSSNLKKNITCFTQVLTKKMFETSITRKIIVHSSTTQHLITNCGPICDHYDNNLDYQTGWKMILPSYGKDTLPIPLDNSFLDLANVCFFPNIGFNLINTVQLGKKEIKMWLQTTN